MNNLLKLSVIFLLLLNACSTEKVEEVTPEAEDNISQELMSNLFNSARTATSTNQESDYVEDGECFVINYPYNVSDGQTSTTLNSDEELFVFLENLTFDSDVFIEVPFGTIIRDSETQEVLFEITKDNKEQILLEGGMGGLGNWNFRSSTNQTPRYAQPGIDGKENTTKTIQYCLEHPEWKLSIQQHKLIGMP